MLLLLPTIKAQDNKTLIVSISNENIISDIYVNSSDNDNIFGLPLKNYVNYSIKTIRG